MSGGDRIEGEGSEDDSVDGDNDNSETADSEMDGIDGDTTSRRGPRSIVKKTVIEGNSVTLVRSLYGHSLTLFKLLRDPDVNRYLSVDVDGLSGFRREFMFYRKEWELNMKYMYTIIINGENLPIGQVSLYHLNFYHMSGEVGIWIGKPYWNKGYAREALRLILDYAFNDLNLNRIQARIFTFNDRSIRLFEQVGFKREGLQRQLIKKGNKFVDCYCYSLLKGEFDKENP